MKHLILAVLISALAILTIRFFASYGVCPLDDELTPDENGMIHNRCYGDYPATVEYRQGMTIYPGQRARMGIPLPPIEPEKDTRQGL